MTGDMNTTLFQWIHSGAGTRPVLDTFAILVAEGGPYLLIILFGMLWLTNNKKITLLEATETAMIGLMTNQLIGLFYFHPRPFMIGLGTPLFPHGPESSFPSDHATFMFAATFYLLTAGGLATSAWALLLLTALTAWARVYSGVHFPFDMAGSLVVGLTSTWLMRWLTPSLRPWNTKLLQISEQFLPPFFRTKGQDTKKQ